MNSDIETAAYDHAHLVDAVNDAVEWGYTRPRRWLGFYGGITITGQPRLNRQYRQHLAAIRQLVPRPVNPSRY